MRAVGDAINVCPQLPAPPRLVRADAVALRTVQMKLGTEGRERNLKRYVMDVRVVKKQSLGYRYW